MSKYSLVFIFLVFIISCKNQEKSKSDQSSNSATVFSLKSTSCMGQCPEYEIVIKGDSTIYFEGKKFTAVEGSANKKLSSEEYSKIMSMIQSVGWSKLNKEYVSQMSDLPSFTYTYNAKRVYQYGPDPKSLTKLREELLAIIDNKDFF